MYRPNLRWPLLLVLLGDFSVTAVAAAPQDSAGSTTYNKVPLSDSASSTVESADNEPAPSVLAPMVRWLEDRGINYRGSLIDQYARNPSGGVDQGHTNVGQFNSGLDLNLHELAGLQDGFLFHVVVYRDYGDALNQDFTGTFTKQQYIYKNAFPRWHLGLFAFEQRLFNDRLDIFLGRLGSTNYYGHLVTNCQFISGTLCGEPRILVAEAGLSLLPSATWGTNIKYRPTPHSYIETGIFEVNPTVQPSNGLHWSTHDATGFTVPVEWAWVDSNPRTTAYPFELKAGAFVSTAPLSDPLYNTKGTSRGLHGGTAQIDGTDRYGVYTMADRVIWRPDPGRSQSLNVFGGFVQQLEQAEIMRQQAYAGFVLTAPFKDRSRDTLALSVSEFELTPNERYFLRDARIKAGGSGTNAAHQIDYDLTYTLHVTRGVEVMGSLQYIIHPDNSTITATTTVPDNLFAFSLGVRMDLGYALGFSRGAASD
jgi:porin